MMAAINFFVTTTPALYARKTIVNNDRTLMLTSEIFIVQQHVLADIILNRDLGLCQRVLFTLFEM